MNTDITRRQLLAASGYLGLLTLITPSVYANEIPFADWDIVSYNELDSGVPFSIHYHDGTDRLFTSRRGKIWEVNPNGLDIINHRDEFNFDHNITDIIFHNGFLYIHMIDGSNNITEMKKLNAETFDTVENHINTDTVVGTIRNAIVMYNGNLYKARDNDGIIDKYDLDLNLIDSLNLGTDWNTAITMDGNGTFFVNSRDGTDHIYIAFTEDLTILDTLEVDSQATRAMHYYQNKVIGAGNNGLLIIDASDENNLEQLGFVAGNDNSRDAKIGPDDMLYAIRDEGSGERYIDKIDPDDLDTPDEVEPVETWTDEENISFRELDFSQAYLYFVTYSSGPRGVYQLDANFACINNLHNLSLGGKIECLANDKTVQSLFVSTLFAGKLAQSTRNPWIGLGTFFAFMLIAWAIGWVPLGMIFAAMFFTVMAVLGLQKINRTQNVETVYQIPEGVATGDITDLRIDD